MTRLHRCLLLIASVLCINPLSAAEPTPTSPVDVWASLLKPKYFGVTPLKEGRSIIDMRTPYRAEDAAFTPVSLTAGIVQSESRYIKDVYVFVESNPQPLAAVFHLTPAAGARRSGLARACRPVHQYSRRRGFEYRRTPPGDQFCQSPGRLFGARRV